jgi:hypothetical protein
MMFSCVLCTLRTQISQSIRNFHTRQEKSFLIPGDLLSEQAFKGGYLIFYLRREKVIESGRGA